MVEGSFLGTRTRGTVPADSAARTSCWQVSGPSKLCSASMSTKSNPRWPQNSTTSGELKLSRVPTANPPAAIFSLTVLVRTGASSRQVGRQAPGSAVVFLEAPGEVPGLDHELDYCW